MPKAPSSPGLLLAVIGALDLRDEPLLGHKRLEFGLLFLEGLQLRTVVRVATFNLI